MNKHASSLCAITIITNANHWPLLRVNVNLNILFFSILFMVNSSSRSQSSLNNNATERRNLEILSDKHDWWSTSRHTLQTCELEKKHACKSIFLYTSCQGILFFQNIWPHFLSCSKCSPWTVISMLSYILLNIAIFIHNLDWQKKSLP